MLVVRGEATVQPLIPAAIAWKALRAPVAGALAVYAGLVVSRFIFEDSLVLSLVDQPVTVQ